VSRPILLDANVLLLLLVGQFDRELVGEFKRTRNQGFTSDDFDLILEILGHFQVILTTPHILAEVSNLSDDFFADHRADYFSAFERALSVLQEPTLPSAVAASDPIFPTLGLTDAGISTLCRTMGTVVITVDAPLCAYLERKGHYAFNFNTVKSSGWNMDALSTRTP
jgi:hypothetical protein